MAKNIDIFEDSNFVSGDSPVTLDFTDSGSLVTPARQVFIENIGFGQIDVEVTYDGTNFETYEDVIQAADQNLYEAKETGRNRTVYKKAA